MHMYTERWNRKELTCYIIYMCYMCCNSVPLYTLQNFNRVHWNRFMRPLIDVDVIAFVSDAGKKSPCALRKPAPSLWFTFLSGGVVGSCNYYLSSKLPTVLCTLHDDVIKWKHFPRYGPFAWGIHRSPVNSPHRGQWRGALMFALICAWVNNRAAGYLRRYRAHYDVSVMASKCAYEGL